MANIINNLGNTVNQVAQSVNTLYTTLGKAALHSLYPDDFEYYLCSLELLDSTNTTKGFLIFPVMPNSITESQTPIKSITKTNRGLTTLFNDSFNPIDISIQGSFGRKIRIMSGLKQVANPGTIPFFQLNTGNANIDKNSIAVKTGYGVMKTLQYMIKTADQIDDKKKPYVLVFNNYSLNSHYVVEVVQSAFTQSVENNMIWFYSLEFKAVAPAEAVKQIDGNNKVIDMLTTVAPALYAKELGNILTKVSKILSL